MKKIVYGLLISLVISSYTYKITFIKSPKGQTMLDVHALHGITPIGTTGPFNTQASIESSKQINRMRIWNVEAGEQLQLHDMNNLKALPLNKNMRFEVLDDGSMTPIKQGSRTNVS